MRSLNPLRMNVAFAGLTAAGKTTHARMLADFLGYEYISATEILLDLAGIDPASDKAWFEHLDSISAMRSGDELDDELERRLIEIASDNDGLVLDTWAMPWIHHAPMIRLWLESDRLSRTWKCYVSQGQEPSRDLVQCSQLIDKKDRSTRDIFRRRHGFDLFNSKGVFDAVIENTRLIQEPSRSASDEGIAAFAPVVQSVVESLLAADPSILNSAIQTWTPVQRECILYVAGPLEGELQ